MTIMFTRPPGDTLAILRTRINLAARLTQYGVDAALNEDRIAIGKLLDHHYQVIADEFYEFLRNTPESAKVIHGKNLPLLKEYQRVYWHTLFATQIDDAFVDRSIIVGFTHYRIGLPPHVYMAGYTFFLNRLTDKILLNMDMARACRLLGQATGLVHLDMSISLAAYFFLGLRTTADSAAGRHPPG